LRKFLHIICSLWLSSLLLFGGTPKELLHTLAAHRDTVHRHGRYEIVIETMHHHCSFLGCQLMPFSTPLATPVILRAPLPGYISYMPVQDLRALQQIVALREGRGPPDVV
jgi:hypothetical protein